MKGLVDKVGIKLDAAVEKKVPAPLPPMPRAPPPPQEPQSSSSSTNQSSPFPLQSAPLRNLKDSNYSHTLTLAAYGSDGKAVLMDGKYSHLKSEDDFWGLEDPNEAESTKKNPSFENEAVLGVYSFLFQPSPSDVGDEYIAISTQSNPHQSTIMATTLSDVSKSLIPSEENLSKLTSAAHNMMIGIGDRAGSVGKNIITSISNITSHTNQSSSNPTTFASIEQHAASFKRQPLQDSNHNTGDEEINYFDSLEKDKEGINSSTPTNNNPFSNSNTVSGDMAGELLNNSLSIDSQSSSSVVNSVNKNVEVFNIQTPSGSSDEDEVEDEKIPHVDDTKVDQKHELPSVDSNEEEPVSRNVASVIDLLDAFENENSNNHLDETEKFAEKENKLTDLKLNAHLATEDKESNQVEEMSVVADHLASLPKKEFEDNNKKNYDVEESELITDETKSLRHDDNHENSDHNEQNKSSSPIPVVHVEESVIEEKHAAKFGDSNE